MNVATESPATGMSALFAASRYAVGCCRWVGGRRGIASVSSEVEAAKQERRRGRWDPNWRKVMAETKRWKKAVLTAAALGTVWGLGSLPVRTMAQGDMVEMQQRILELKESTARNKEQLAHYTWVQQLTVVLKGTQRKQESFQVHMGPDGKPVKVAIDPQAQAPPRGGRLRQRIVEKKKEEFEEYAERMKLLAERYIPPDKDAIQDAHSKGNVSITPGVGGIPGNVSIAIRNYVKTGDLMTIVFNKTTKKLESLTIATYLDEPSDPLRISVNFASLPDGTSHVSAGTIESVSKQLNISTQNSDYRKL